MKKLFLFFLVVFLVSSLYTPAYSEEVLKVHFIDVGQGDGILIEFPDGKLMMIDGGPRSCKSDLLSYLNSVNVDRFEYLMLTHSDEDHVGSLDDVITSYDVDTIYMPDFTKEEIGTVVYSTFVEVALAEGATIIYSVEGLSFSGDGYSFTIYSPSVTYYDEVTQGSLDSLEKNNASPICILEYGGRKIMFTGDADARNLGQGEDYFLSNALVNAALYDVDVLKVAHHGSANSTTERFLDVVKTEYAVISVGEGNSYGHPDAATLEKLSGSEVYRTDLNGNIVLSVTSGGEISFDCEKNAPSAPSVSTSVSASAALPTASVSVTDSASGEEPAVKIEIVYFIIGAAVVIIILFVLTAKPKRKGKKR